MRVSAVLARLRRLWFQVSTLPTRGRFMTGRASFVEADVHRNPDNTARLDTRAPRSGLQGWQLYLERAAGGGPHVTASLQCGWCRHLFIVQIHAAPEAGLAPSYDSDWFRFFPERGAGEPSLSCPRCEQESRPAVCFLPGGG